VKKNSLRDNPMTQRFISRRGVTMAAVVALVSSSVFFGVGLRAEEAAKTTGIEATNVTAVASSGSTINNPEADKAWKEVLKASQPPMPPKEWLEKKPTPEEMSNFYVPLLTTAADKAKEFYTKYPENPKADEARKKEVFLLGVAVQRYGDTNLVERLQKLDKTVLVASAAGAGPEVSPEEMEVRKQIPEIQKLASGLPATAGQLEEKAHELLKKFPKHQIGYELLMLVAPVEKPDKAKALLQEVAASENAPEFFRSEAMDILTQLDRLGKPVDIKFTAMDGRKVDLEDMKGKVVLVDFWATWCGPCVAAIPEVKEVYNKLHSKGFEVIGISLDQSKEALENFVKEKELPWPQYFDGEMWQNKFAQKYGIHGIPAMWLVDKKGNLQNVNVRGNLEANVASLLEEAN
jgi:thiol-disulfide isomerase/thioredoxin